MEKQEFTPGLLNYLSGFVTARRLDKMHKVLNQRTRHISVVLEDVYQSQNASAVLRSCECFGIQDVHIVENQNLFEVNPDIALGSDKWLTLHKYEGRQQNNTKQCLQGLKDNGYRIVATTPYKNNCTLEELPLNRKTALVFGTEMHGLSKQALGLADGFLRIPMHGFTESFNVSVSAAISLYHLGKRMRRTVPNWQLSETEKEHLLFEWVKKSIKDPELIIRHFLGSVTNEK